MGTLILTILVAVDPRNIHKKFEEKPCNNLREVFEIAKKFTTSMTTMDTG